MIDSSTLRVALRTLARHKGFATVAILSLGIAIALNTVMYSVMVAMLDPRISVKDPAHIYTFLYYGNFRRSVPVEQVEEALRAGAKDLVDVTGYTAYRMNYRGGTPVVESNDKYKRVENPIVVRPNFFDFLGTPPVEGRTFRPSDETEGGTPAVISHRLAAYLYPNESAVGQQLMLDGNGYTVIGVIEYLPGFPLLRSDLYILRPSGSPQVRLTLMRFTHVLEPFTLNEQLKLAAARLAHAANEPTEWTSFRGKQVYLRGYNSALLPFQRGLMAAVLAVLVVACANLANMQLARGLVRSRELALRSAVGATRRQLIQLLTLETGILAAAGLALGIVLTLWGIYVVRASIPEAIADMYIAPEVRWVVFAFAGIATVVCLVLVGLLPALRISRVDPNEMLKAGAGTGANKQHRRRYGIMVVAQIGFALPVLIAGVMLLRSAWIFHSRDFLARERFGYDIRPIVQASVNFARDSVRRLPPMLALAEELTTRAKSIPGVVEAAAYAGGSGRDATVTVAELNGDQKEVMANGMSYRIVSPSYFRALGREIIKGRGFTDTEIDGRAVIIDQRTAKFLFKDADPIGRSIKLAARGTNATWHEVVGVVGDRRSWAAIERADPYAGFQVAEVYRAISEKDSLRGGLSVYARVDGSTELAALRFQRNLRSVRGVRGSDRASAEPLEFTMGVVFMRQVMDFFAALFATFALVGISLVAIGVYSIVAHSVEERRREIAVRISMGATMRDILRAVLREGNALIMGGVAVGLFLSFMGRWMVADLIDPADVTRPSVYAVVAAGLFALAVFVAFIPALRATRIDPVEALRHE